MLLFEFLAQGKESARLYNSIRYLLELRIVRRKKQIAQENKEQYMQAKQTYVFFKFS